MANAIHKTRSPDKTILTAQFNSQNGDQGWKHAYHPYRYFLADGVSLQKIEDFIHDAKNILTSYQNFAQSVGADSFDGTYFTFNGAQRDKENSGLKFMLNHPKRGQGFWCDPASMGEFAPNLDYAGHGYFVQIRIDEIATLPASQQQAEWDTLAKEVDADSFDGTYFKFSNWQKRVDNYATEERYRLKCNPVFVSKYSDNDDYFEPDLYTATGRDIYRKSRELKEHALPEQRFAKWLNAFNLKTNPHGHPRFGDSPKRPNDNKNVELEQIGDKWIIKVPVVGEGYYGKDGRGGGINGYQESWSIPEGAQPISISDYFKLLEGNGLVSQTPGTKPML